MQARLALAALALAVAAPAGADEERARDRVGGSAPSGERALPAASSSSHSGPSYSSDSSSRSEGRSSPTLAQRRHPRAGTGRGDRGHSGRGGYYGRPGYYDYWWPYGFYGYGYYGYYGYYGNYGYAPYSRGYRHYSDAGAVRVKVEPKKARVYVDGYYAGIADDFDGLFQRLYLAPGRHQIVLRLEGYRSQSFRVYVPLGHTIKIHHDMVRGSGEGAEETVGDPVLYGRGLEDEDWDDRGRRARDERRDDEGEDEAEGSFGTLQLDVRPGDASIYVDGRFRGLAREQARLRLAPGRHRIEVVRPGFRTIEREVVVEEGQTAEVSVELERS